MNMPYIPGLRADIWRSSSPQERVTALQELEDNFARQEGREFPCQVRMLENMDKYKRGEHNFKDGIEHIDINANVVLSPDAMPYESVETLCHESRHAYQCHVIGDANSLENNEQFQDWQKNLTDGYLNPPSKAEENPNNGRKNLEFSEYRWQPVEADANETARQRTDDLYQNTFNDTETYPEYKKVRERELERDKEEARKCLGENYQETARQLMLQQYQERQAEKVSLQEAEGYDEQQAVLEKSSSEQNNLEQQKTSESPEESMLDGQSDEDRLSQDQSQEELSKNARDIQLEMETSDDVEMVEKEKAEQVEDADIEHAVTEEPFPGSFEQEAAAETENSENAEIDQSISSEDNDRSPSESEGYDYYAGYGY